jgi:phage N-6-adenine-methyltransferase
MEVHYSSKTNEWATPQDFYNQLNERFNFTLDPCATHENHKCSKYYTLDDNGLSQNWGGETVFCNPPYGRGIKHWVKKCYEESIKPNAKQIVMLIPARTDTTYFHDYIYHKAKIEFIKGRLRFGDGKGPAPFPSMLVIYN